MQPRHQGAAVRRQPQVSSPWHVVMVPNAGGGCTTMRDGGLKTPFCRPEYHFWDRQAGPGWVLASDLAEIASLIYPA
jgi:hypothetical protein